VNSEVALQHGKLYDCASYCDGTVEEQSIIPLAVDTKGNRRWLLLDARRLFVLNPSRVRHLINMTFEDLSNSDFSSNYDLNWSAMLFVCTIMADGSLEDYAGNDLFAFTETDVIE
jgi:hypothetical protein